MNHLLTWQSVPPTSASTQQGFSVYFSIDLISKIEVRHFAGTEKANRRSAAKDDAGAFRIYRVSFGTEFFVIDEAEDKLRTELDRICDSAK